MMTEIEKKAWALVNEVLAERGISACEFIDRNEHVADEALCRAIEQHEAHKREVSDAVEAFHRHNPFFSDMLARFIIAKPDPLVEVLTESFSGIGEPLEAWSERDAKAFRAALAARGLEVRKIEGGA